MVWSPKCFEGETKRAAPKFLPRFWLAALSISVLRSRPGFSNDASVACRSGSGNPSLLAILAKNVGFQRELRGLEGIQRKSITY